MTRSPTPTRPRLALISRIVAAVIGGYALASVFSIFLSYLLPSELPEAVLGATLFSFAIYTAAIIWVFAAASATRAWLGLLIPGALMGGLSCALQFAGSAA
jgi:hypothetical protein